MDIRVGLWSLLVAGAACGSSSPTGSGGNPPAGPVADVSMTDNNGLAPYAVSPGPLNTKVATSGGWNNNGNPPHTAPRGGSPQPGSCTGTSAPSRHTKC